MAAGEPTGPEMGGPQIGGVQTAGPEAGGALAIIAGGGALPVQVARDALASGRRTVVLALAGEAAGNFTGLPHLVLKWGEIGRLFEILKREAVSEIVLAGTVTRPDYSDIKVDLGGIMSLPQILKIARGGDDAVLMKVVRYFEARGYSVIGAHQVAPSLLVGEGFLTRARPDDDDREDMAAGLEAARAVGRLDIGQAAVAHGGRAIAVEGLERTDGLIDRAKALRESGLWRVKGRGGVLVKVAKPQQDLRVDMPVIGPDTVARAAAAGLKGIAVEAGRVMVLDRDQLVADADAAGLFVAGV